MTAPAGIDERSNRRMGRDCGLNPSKIRVVSDPWFMFTFCWSSHVSSPTAGAGCRLRRVDGPEVAARVTLPGQRARSTFVTLSGAAKSAAVVLFHGAAYRSRAAVAPEISVVAGALCESVLNFQTRLDDPSHISVFVESASAA